jgi:glycosyltransferase involved in cell wall biosynthesis
MVVGYITKVYPTGNVNPYISREMYAVSKGVKEPIQIFTRDKLALSPSYLEVSLPAQVFHITPKPLRHPKMFSRALLQVLHHKEARPVMLEAVTDVLKRPTLATLNAVTQSVLMTHQIMTMPNPPTRLHAHFLRNGLTGYYVSKITGIPLSVTGHYSRDILGTDRHETSVSQKKKILARADYVVACTDHGKAMLTQFCDNPAKIHVVHHGTDLNFFAPPPPGLRDDHNKGNQPNKPVELLTVCRAESFKGLDDMLVALSLLPKDLNWHWTHIGSGFKFAHTGASAVANAQKDPLLETLKQEAQRLGIADRITWMGQQNQEVVRDQYRKANLFVLPCKINEEGIHDGLPNVIVEAGSQKLPSLSTPVGSVTDFVAHGQTGWLCETKNPKSLAQAMEKLITDSTLRNQLGEKAFERVHESFDMMKTTAPLVPVFS